MAINGIELEVGQEWLTRGGHQVEVVNGPVDGLWPFIVRRDAEVRYSVDCAGFAMSPDCPRGTDLVRPVNLGIDLPLQPTAEPQDANTVTSAQVNDWIDWHGGECPVGPSTPVEVRLRSGSELTVRQPGDMRWIHRAWTGDIVAYRVAKPVECVGNLKTALVTDTHTITGIGDINGDINSDAKGSGARYNNGKAPLELPAMAEPLRVVGDINSVAKGSGARYNNGKAPLELIPLSIIAASFQHDARLSLTDRQVRALAALDALGMFQAREGDLIDVLHELGDHWEDCAKVFDYGRRKYAEWNWAKGMKWSVPIGCAARHLMVIIRGEETDPESGLPHVGHVYCNVVMLLTYASTFVEGDDRPAKGMLL